VPSRSDTSTSKYSSAGARPATRADSATLCPTRWAFSSLRTPLISIDAQSTGTPWQPSEPWSSTSARIRSRVS
jgi:hypothetical protein